MKLDLSLFFSARTQSLPVDRSLSFDIFLKISDELILFKRVGDVLNQNRLDDLLKHKVKQIYIPKEQRSLYLESLKNIVRDPGVSTETRGRFIKETAFNHIEELFSNKDVNHVAKESVGLVENMVEFISSDLSAAASLMKLSSHDYYTYNHSVNVSVYSIAICKHILGNNKDTLITVGLGGLLHDLGKRKVDTKLINKPGKLSDEEWVEMKKHPGFGFELLQEVSAVPERSKRIVHEHHENMDGTGYPNGLSENQILKLSRITTVADVFDALTTKRSYKDACSAKEALEIMANMPEGKFDPEVFKLLETQTNKKTDITLDKNVDPCLPHLPVKKAS